MSDLSLMDVIALIRAEIARTEIGEVKRIVGPQGPQGVQGEAGIQGPQGPRGNDGKQGPKGDKGIEGKQGPAGVKGDDGADGVGIARVEQDIDNAIVVYLTDGNQYTIEMPIIQDDGSLSKEVHYKSGGGGGSGVVNLSGYVKRPSDTHDGKWLLYREADGTNQGEWAPATTDLIETNSTVIFRDKKGRFKETKNLPPLGNQLDVNRYIADLFEDVYETIDLLQEKGYDDTALKQEIAQEAAERKDADKHLQDQIDELTEHHKEPAPEPTRDPIFAEQAPTEYPAQPPEPLEVDDQWYEVTDPDFDYDNPDPEGLDLYIWTQVGDDFEWVLFVEERLEYVSKTGGDEMEGPLKIKAQDPSKGRDTNRVQTLGVYSQSEGSALRLGTTRDRVYVGHDDTSFNGPIKVGEIQEKTEGEGVTHKHKELFEAGLQLKTPNADATDSNHPDYNWYSKYPLSVKDAQFVTRFGVDVSDGNGPYAWDESQKPFQGVEDRNLATIGLLKDRAVTYYPAAIPSLGELNLKIFASVAENKDVGISEAHIDSAYTRLALNHDPIGAGAGIGRVDWLEQFPDTSDMFIQQGDNVYKLNVTADGAKGSNDRAKHFIINSHDIVANALVEAPIAVGKTGEKRENIPYLASYQAHKSLETKVDELEQEIDIIAPRLEGASYTYSASPSVKAGEMHVMSGSFTSGTDVILFNDVALDGKTHTWAALNVGDYIEVTDTLQTRTAENYAMYLVSKAPEGTGLKQIDVALVKGQGAPTAGDVMDAKGFQLAGNDINDLDARYALKNHTHSGMGTVTITHGYKTSIELSHGSYGDLKYFVKYRNAYQGTLSEASVSTKLKSVGEVKFKSSNSNLYNKVGQMGLLVAHTSSSDYSYPYLVMNVWQTASSVEYGIPQVIFRGTFSWCRENDLDSGTFQNAPELYWTWHGDPK